LKGGGLFAFAGLWDVWTDGKEKSGTCCVIALPANDLVRPIHDRMPRFCRWRRQSWAKAARDWSNFLMISKHFF